MNPIQHVKSTISLVVITLNMTFWVVVLLVLGLGKFSMPFARGGFDRAMDGVYRAAVVMNDAWLRGVLGLEWNRGETGLARDDLCIVISNHSSWSDIFLLQSAVSRDGPLLKFLSKRELVFVPIFGVIFWAFDFPLLRRRAKGSESEGDRRAADALALRAACDSVRARPSALMNFAEGTRATTARLASAESPYETLLRPRVGGLAALLEALDGDLAWVVDVTLVYPEPITFWRLLAGDLAPIEIDVELDRPETLPKGRAALVDWLDERWRRKDARIERVRSR